MLDNAFVAFLVILLGFGLLIFVHELGHFLAAKAVGIKVTQFAIGFGPPIVSWRKGLGFRVGGTEAEHQKRLDAGADPASMGETEYRLNYLAVLGGYVKMLGQEDLDPAARSTDPRAYNSKPVWARTVVISAGVVMNVIFGLLFLVVAFRAGVMFPPAVVGDVADGSPAAVTYAQGHAGDPALRGLRIGDRITHLDGEPILDLVEVRIATALGEAGQPIAFTIDRPGRDQPLTYLITPEPSRASQGLLSAGILPPSSLRLLGVPAHGPLYDAGVRPGMTLTAVNGQPIEDQAALVRAMQQAAGRPVELIFEPPGPGEPVTAQATPAPSLSFAEGEPHLAGLVPAARAIIDASLHDRPAYKAGVRDGDLFAQVGSVAWPTVPQLMETVQAAGSRPVPIVVWRDGERIDLGGITPQGGLIGVGLSYALDTPVVAATLPGSPAEPLALPPGSRIIALDGEPVQSWADLQRILASAAASTQAQDEPPSVAVTYELALAGRPVEEARLTLGPAAREQLAATRWLPPMGLAFHPLLERVAGENLFEAAAIGVSKTHQFMLQTYLTLLRLFEGTVQVSHLRGPVGIVDEGARIAEQGWAYLVFFLGLISINLAVVNFLPVPITDGGHMVFLMIEKLTGKPPSLRLQAAATYLGLALLATVFLVVTYHDLSRILGG